jgi:hypothetical protein
MDAITEIILGLATNYLANYTQKDVEDIFRKAIGLKPKIKDELLAAKTNQDIEKIFKDAVGVIDAQAGSGDIAVNQNVLTAIRGIRFDHQNGTVTISGSTIKAPVLQTGGSGNGQTTITGTNLKSAGTEIQLGAGASIVMTGNAKITQT